MDARRVLRRGQGRFSLAAAVDMKGGIACSVAAVLQYLADTGGEPKGSISFLITGDEEDISVNGTIKLLKWCERARNSIIACSASRRMSRRSATASRSAAAARSPARLCRRRAGPCRLSAPGVEPGAGYSRLIVALSDEPLTTAARSFRLPISNSLPSTSATPRAMWIPGQARAKFQHPLQRQPHPGNAARAGRGTLTKACGNRIRARIVWEYSNSNVFVTKPGAFTDLAVSAIEEVTAASRSLDQRRHFGCALHFELLPGDRARPGRPDHASDRRTHAGVRSGEADEDLSGRVGPVLQVANAVIVRLVRNCALGRTIRYAVTSRSITCGRSVLATPPPRGMTGSRERQQSRDRDLPSSDCSPRSAVSSRPDSISSTASRA